MTGQRADDTHGCLAGYQKGTAYVEFGDALRLLKAGQEVSRRDWDTHFEPQPVLRFRPGHADGVQIELTASTGAAAPWVPTQMDLLSVDWFHVSGVHGELRG